MLDPDLLQILVCPVTHQSLSMAGEDLLARVNERIRGGAQKNVGGEAVAKELAAGLVREDGNVLYPIVDGIPVLLEDEGLPLA